MDRKSIYTVVWRKFHADLFDVRLQISIENNVQKN